MTGIIENTVKKVRDGADLVSAVNETFPKAEAEFEKISELIGEVAAGSGKQAQGISEINRTVSDVDQVVQISAANGEDLTGTSEEMNAQSARMTEFVQELAALAGWKGRAKQRRSRYSDQHHLKPGCQSPLCPDHLK